jgi:predicted PurR-regulated permease PerM/ActR/RegA family two-component response regulator
MIKSSDILRGKILIVDDKEVNIILLERTLRGAGYASVSSTMDPRRACGLHRENTYDLILLDLEMPGMDGFQVMEKLKTIDPEGFLPVLAVTADPAHKLRALRAGMKDFISKPFDLTEVLIRVHNMLEIRLLHEAARNEGKAALKIGAPSAEAPIQADAPAPSRGVVRFELAPRTIAWIAAALGGAWLVDRLWMILLLMVVALVFVGTFNPIVESLEARGLKRMQALILLVLALALAAALLVFLTVPPLLDQLARIVRELPDDRLKLIDMLGRFGLTAPFGRALSNIDLDQGFERIRTYLVGRSADAESVVGCGITASSLAFYLLADGNRTQGTLYAVVPRDYHMRLARIIHNLETIVGGYMRGQLITSLAFGTYTFLLLAACGVRNALALALLAAILDVIPFAGGLLATLPAVLTALGRGPSAAVVVLGGMFIYQQFENKVLVPRVYGRVLRLSPAVVVLALIAGGTLLGVIGALLALPIAAGLQMIIEELGVDLPGDDSDDPTARARDRKTEAAYELMSSGSTPLDAGQIASGLAHDIRDADAWVAANRAKK